MKIQTKYRSNFHEVELTTCQYRKGKNEGRKFISNKYSRELRMEQMGGVFSKSLVTIKAY